MAHDPPVTTYKINRGKVDAEYLRNKLKLKSLEVRQTFLKQFPRADKYLKEKGIDLAKLRKRSAKLIGAGALTGTLILSFPIAVKGAGPLAGIISSAKDLAKGIEGNLPQKFLIDFLKASLPDDPKPLKSDEEKTLEQILAKVIGIKVRANLEGERLNTSFGLIGAEQHLKRYPGDSVFNHGPFYDEGMAPGLGAWGYFASSREKLTKSLEETERWYAVVQTLYLPDWDKRAAYLREWYKYRKILIVNTKNGNAVVAAIADSGPAAWTGKQFGGSPEVMEYLGGPRYKKGAVFVFFVDDPENKIPLVPVDYNKTDLSEEFLTQV